MTTGLDVAPRQSGPQVWIGADLSDPSIWTWRLSDAEVDELVEASSPYRVEPPEALAGIAERPLDLPILAERAASLREQLTHGRGFELIKGFPSADLTEMHCSAAFVGLGALLGSARSQNAEGDLLGHVRNTGADANDPNVRIYQTDQRQTFHTDSSDVVGLMCLETAAEGGESLIVSAGAIYNEMLDVDPDLTAVLFDPIATDRRGEVPDGAKPYFTIPVFTWFEDALTVMYQRQYIESAQRFVDAPRLTETTTAALNLFDQVANDPKMRLAMRLDVGDMQFVHNHSLVHDRTAYRDKPGSPRHLLRLWLSVAGDRPLPPVFAQRFGTTDIGNRGGIVTAGK